MKWPALLVAALLLLQPTLALAQDFTVDVEPGWDGLFVEDGWTPLRVTLRAPRGSAPIRGRVVTEPVPLERVSCSDAPFSLTPTSAEGSVARVVLAIPARGDLSFTVRIEDEEGHELATASPLGLPRRIEPKDRLVLLARRDGGLAALEGQAPPTVANPTLPPIPQGARLTRSQMQLLRAAQAAHAGPSSVRLARIPPEDLRVSPFLLSSASGIVLMDGPGAAELAQDSERTANLETFVRNGGTLVVVGGSGGAFWLNTPLERLLPVTCRGEPREASGRDLAFLGDARTLAPITIFQATLAPDRAGVPGAQWLPDAERLAAARSLGRGRVIFLAFDPDRPELRESPNLGAFLANLLPAPHSRTPFVPGDRLAESSGRIFFERASVTTSGLLALAAGVAAMTFILGPIAARRRRSPLRTLVAPGLSIILAIVVLVTASLTRGPPEVRVVSWTFTESGAPDGIVVSDVGIYSGEALVADLALDGNASLTPLEASKVDLLTFRGHRSALRLAAGAPALVTPVELTARAFTWFRASAQIDRPEATRVSAKVEKQDLVLRAGPAGAPGGFVLYDDPGTHQAFVIETLPCGATDPTIVPLRSGRPLADCMREDEAAPQIWDRAPADRTRSHVLRTLVLLADEIHLANQQSHASRVPHVWFAYAEEPPSLLSPRERGTPIERAAWLGCTLVAAESEP